MDHLDQLYGLQKLLIQKRHQQGLTQAQVAERMGTGASTICNLEKGIPPRVSYTTMYKWAAALGYEVLLMSNDLCDEPLDLDAIEPPRWMDGAAAHALALLLARARFGPGVDMGGRDNPMPSEEIAGKRFMQDLIDNGWLNPAEVAALRAELNKAKANECTALCGDVEQERDELRAELDAQRYAYSVAREQALREEIKRLQRQVDLLTAYDEAYWATQTELDRLLGTEEDDGSGAGLAAEVRLLGEQRDDARAEAERWKSLAMKLMVQAAIIMGEK